MAAVTEERQPVRHSIEEKDGRIVIEFDKVGDEKDGYYEVTEESVEFVPHCGSVRALEEIKRQMAEEILDGWRAAEDDGVETLEVGYYGWTDYHQLRVLLEMVATRPDVP